MSKNDYKYCIGAGAPLCSQCKRHRPYTQPNSPECKEWTMVVLNQATGFCSMFAPKGSEWVSTSNALPPLKARVLIVERAWYWSAQNPASTITHWQPLPQLPREL